MFKPASTLKARRRLVVSIEGPPKTGKTHFLLTAPRPIKAFNIDYGFEGVVQDMEDRGWDLEGVEIEDYALSKVPPTKTGSVDRARHLIQEFVGSYRSNFLNAKVPTTGGIDTGSEFWQLFRLADLGKLREVPPLRYSRVNSLFRDLMNEVFHTPHSLIITHRTKPKYENKVTETGKEVSIPVPGEFDREGFKEMDGVVQVVLRSYRRIKKGHQVFGFKVEECRQRVKLVGERYEGESATFGSLAMDIFPQSAPEDWGL